MLSVARAWTFGVGLALGSHGAVAQSVPPRWTVPVEHPAADAGSAKSVFVRKLQGAGASVLLKTSFGLVSYREDGTIRWRYLPHPGCDALAYQVCYPWIENFAPSPDGGAWMLEDVGPPTDTTPDRLRRLDSRGALVVEHQLGGLPGHAGSDQLLHVGSDGAMVFWAPRYAASDKIAWLKAQGTAIAARGEISLPGHGWIGLERTREAIDGTVLLLYVPDTAPNFCAPLQYCGDLRKAVIKVTGRGEVAWRTEFDVVNATDATFGPDDSTWAVGPAYGQRIQRISHEGKRSAPFEIPFLDRSSAEVASLAATRPNQVLVHTQSAARRIDAAGTVLATQGWEADRYLQLQHSTPRPESIAVVSAKRPDGDDTRAAVLDGETLRVLDVPVVPLGAGRPSLLAFAEFGNDGALFVLYQGESTDRTPQAWLMRFDLAGSPAAGRLYRDGFD